MSADRLAELERENRTLRLENASLKTAMRRSSLYSLSKDRLIEVITAEKSKQEKFLGRLLENSPDVILTLDRDYRFVNCTDVFLRLADIANFGLIKNLTLFDVFDAIAPGTADKMRQVLEAMSGPKETVVMAEVIDMGKNGNPRHYEIHVTRMFERNGEPDGAILLLIDITDVMKAKEDLAALNTAMKELTANISHDLKTPLTVMSVNLEELAAMTRASDDYLLVDLVDAAWQKNLDLQRITQNLFEIGRIEAGQSIYRPKWVPLSDLMMKVQNKYEDFLDDKDLYLDISYSGEADLWLDEQKIWSVFDNIIYNATRYTETGGISITAETGAENTIVSVRDTGIGIAHKHLPRIFERFYKASDARGGAEGDSGLGLYIVKNIMEAMGGSVTAISEPEKGTEIILTFRKRN